MSDNHEIEQGNEPSSDPESMDDLFLSPDDSQAEEIPFPTPEPDEAPASPQQAAPAVPPPAVPPRPDAPAPGPAPSAPSAADSAKLGEVEAERDEYKNRMMRLAADLENFRKRTAREKDDLRKYGIDRVVLELLPVLDNLERALEHADKSEDSTTIVDGVRMVHRQFVTALEKHGVRGFASKGEMFDPQKHEAIQQMETTDHPTGFVLEEYQKGYYLHERLIRPALVVVVRNPSAEVAPPAADEDPVDPLEEQAEEETSGAELDSQPSEPSEPSDPSDGSDESAAS